MGYRWKEGEALESWKAQQRHETVRLIAAGVVRPRPLSCEGCGKSPDPALRRLPRIYMHHPDYEHPDLVEWLCMPCHKRADHRFPAIATREDAERWHREHPAGREKTLGDQLT